jgi:hypothetical protein
MPGNCKRTLGVFRKLNQTLSLGALAGNHERGPSFGGQAADGSHEKVETFDGNQAARGEHGGRREAVEGSKSRFLFGRTGVKQRPVEGRRFHQATRAEQLGLASRQRREAPA